MSLKPTLTLFFRFLRWQVRELEPTELQNYQFFTRPAIAARKELVVIVCNAVRFLSNVITNDMEEHFDALLRPKWLRSRTTQKTILATLDDYGSQVCRRAAFESISSSMIYSTASSRRNCPCWSTCVFGFCRACVYCAKTLGCRLLNVLQRQLWRWS